MRLGLGNSTVGDRKLDFGLKIGIELSRLEMPLKLRAKPPN